MTRIKGGTCRQDVLQLLDLQVQITRLCLGHGGWGWHSRPLRRHALPLRQGVGLAIRQPRCSFIHTYRAVLHALQAVNVRVRLSSIAALTKPCCC